MKLFDYLTFEIHKGKLNDKEQSHDEEDDLKEGKENVDHFVNVEVKE